MSVDATSLWREIAADLNTLGALDPDKDLACREALLAFAEKRAAAAEESGEAA
jgi:hypothetical protein